jgi:hypothetical protein
MKNKLLISAAAIALIASGGVASAQDKQQGPAHQQAPKAAPAAPKAEMPKAAPKAEMKGEAKGTTGQASPAEKAAPRAEQKPAGTTGQAPAKSEMKGAADTKADVKSRSDNKADMKTGTQTKSDMKAGADAKSNATTGQGAAGARANLTTEQRTKITTSIKQVNARPATNVNFSISIGTRVPRNVHLYPLPVTVVEYYPAWRGYEFILVGDEIVIINPRTFEIVAVIEA